MASSRLALLSMLILPLLVLFLFIDGAIAEDMLFNGETLNAGEFIENGPYRFIMQSDCNLVLYLNKSKALWASGTNGKATSCRVILQDDGNLVIYSGSGTSKAVWSSGTARGSNNYRLNVQTDGNVVIYGAALWATNTVQSRRRGIEV